MYTVRTIEVQPVDPSDVGGPEAGGDGGDDRPTVNAEGDIDETTVNDRREPTDDTETEFDPNVDIDGNVDVFGVDNELARIYGLEVK